MISTIYALRCVAAPFWVDGGSVLYINKDVNVPIFQMADIGLVADLFDVVPILTHKSGDRH
ncbi:hypothetical protein C8024_17975 [Sphingopyxis sp. BSNA05]|uniref:hypothetical protein n=1 Tax=Sphingopyxis sp. BSNA05 TaxID=1236614 RepID=UPI001C27DAC5|nr:hypothetical protein [Sphingopyxis sp. BSNA05]NRD90932.1 hypothetical protein [Sphingopyxis sp. BSNA05]